MHTTLRSSHLDQHKTQIPRVSSLDLLPQQTKSSIQHLGQVRIQLFLSSLGRAQRASSAAVCRNFPEIWVWRAENVIQPLLSSLSLLSLPLLLLHSRLNETLPADDALPTIPSLSPGLVSFTCSFTASQSAVEEGGTASFFIFFCLPFPSIDRY